MQDKRILLTGGTGSFGQGFVSLLLTKPEVRMVRVYSRNEHSQRKMRERFVSDRISFYIGDVRDKTRLSRIMEDVDWVVHAAALKQAPLGEVEAGEFIKTNIQGTLNVIESALDNNIEKCLFISSDKAVEPINLYGATKMVAERAILQANKIRNLKRTKFSCVRYGNVIGTSGSFVEKLLFAKPEDVISITEFHSTRFWLSLEEANKFVWDSLVRMEGGEVFIPKNLKACTIHSLVKAICPDNHTNWIGLRPGDKLHEKLEDGYTSDGVPKLSEEEILNYVGRPRLEVSR